MESGQTTTLTTLGATLLLPQPGVALGFSLLARDRTPESGGKVLPLVIATTVLFEVLGPLLARWQLYRASEWGHEQRTPG